MNMRMIPALAKISAVSSSAFGGSSATTVGRLGARPARRAAR